MSERLVKSTFWLGRYLYEMSLTKCKQHETRAKNALHLKLEPGKCHFCTLAFMDASSI